MIEKLNAALLKLAADEAAKWELVLLEFVQGYPIKDLELRDTETSLALVHRPTGTVLKSSPKPAIQLELTE